MERFNATTLTTEKPVQLSGYYESGELSLIAAGGEKEMRNGLSKATAQIFLSAHQQSNGLHKLSALSAVDAIMARGKVWVVDNGSALSDYTQARWDGEPIYFATWNSHRNADVSEIGQQSELLRNAAGLTRIAVYQNGAGDAVEVLVKQVPSHWEKGMTIWQDMGIHIAAAESYLGSILKRLKAGSQGHAGHCWHPQPSDGNVIRLPGLALSWTREDSRLPDYPEVNSGSIIASRSVAAAICQAMGTQLKNEHTRVQMNLVTAVGLLKGMLVVISDQEWGNRYCNRYTQDGQAVVELIASADSVPGEISDAKHTWGWVDPWKVGNEPDMVEFEGLQAGINTLRAVSPRTVARRMPSLITERQNRIVAALQDGSAAANLDEKPDTSVVNLLLGKGMNQEAEGYLKAKERNQALGEVLDLAGWFGDAKLMQVGTGKTLEQMRSFDRKAEDSPAFWMSGLTMVSTDESALPTDQRPYEGTLAIKWSEVNGKPKPDGWVMSAESFVKETQRLDGHDHDDKAHCILLEEPRKDGSPSGIFWWWVIRMPSTWDSGALLRAEPADVVKCRQLGLEVYPMDGPLRACEDLTQVQSQFAVRDFTDEERPQWTDDMDEMMSQIVSWAEHNKWVGIAALMVAALYHSDAMSERFYYTNSDVIDAVKKMTGDASAVCEGLLDALCAAVKEGVPMEPNAFAKVSRRVEARYAELYLPEAEREVFMIDDVVKYGDYQDLRSISVSRRHTLKRMRRWTRRVQAHANGNPETLTHSWPTAIREAAYQTVKTVTETWERHFYANANDEVSQQRVAEAVQEGYEKSVKAKGYTPGMYAACLIQAVAVQNRRYGENPDSISEPLATGFMSLLPWTERLAYYACQPDTRKAPPTWRCRVSETELTESKPQIGQLCSVKVSPNEVPFLVHAETGEVYGKMGPEALELPSEFRYCGEIPRLGKTDETETPIMVFEVTPEHALRTDRRDDFRMLPLQPPACDA